MSNFLYIILYIKRAGVTYCYKKKQQHKNQDLYIQFLRAWKVLICVALYSFQIH